MKIVGCDLHAEQQSIAMLDSETGEFTEKVVQHEGNAVREFYGSLKGPVVVGIEATGAMQWFLELLEELDIKCRVGHPAKIRAAETRQQKQGAASPAGFGTARLHAQRRDELLRLYTQLEQRIQQRAS